MNEDTTIIIPTKNNQEHIEKTIQQISEHMKKHINIKQIIITDNCSTDETLPKTIHQIHHLKNKNILLITQPKPTTEKKTIIIALEQARTPITIILEPNPNTRLHQIQHQIKKLRKADIILPSRHHKESKTKFLNTKEKIINKTTNQIIRLITKLPYTDLTNTNKAFKTQKTLQILKKTKTTHLYWAELIMIAKKKKIKITETRTHWKQHYTNNKKNISYLLNTIREIKKIKNS